MMLHGMILFWLLQAKPELRTIFRACKSYLIYHKFAAGQCKILIYSCKKEFSSSGFWWLFQLHVLNIIGGVCNAVL